MGAGGNDNIKEEAYINNSPIPVSINNSEKIIEQMKQCICKIIGKKTGTGFFTKIPYDSQLLPVLITNYHVLNKNDINEDNSISISLNNDQEYKKIKLDDSRIIFNDEELDVTIIEIKENIDNINSNNYLEIDENINIGNEHLKNIYTSANLKSIYILNYPKGENIVVSYGIISDLHDNIIQHKCNTEPGSSGSPIISLDSLKVIGIHCGSNKRYNCNEGLLINSAIKKFKREKVSDDSNNNKINEENNFKIIVDKKSEKNNYIFKIISIKEYLQEGRIDYNTIPDEQFLCPKCFKVPEILNFHSDNEKIELICQHHDYMELNIEEYYRIIQNSKYNYLNSQCYKCSIIQKYKDVMFNYCYHCGKDFCQECSYNHLLNRREFIPINEKDIRCLKHFKELFKYFCKDCEENICAKCSEKNHKNHNIIELEEYIHSLNIQQYIDVISEKNKALSDIIRFNQIFLNLKFRNNYYYIKSIINLAKSIKKESLREPYLLELYMYRFETTYQLQKKAIELLNDKFKIILNGNEKKILYQSLKLGDEGFKLISQVQFKFLEEINVPDNNIRNIEPLKLMYLPHLEYLNISYNEIENIEPIAKINSKKIKEICLQYNKIKNISPLLQFDFPELEMLRIEGNNFVHDATFNEVLEKYRNKILFKTLTFSEFKKKYNLENRSIENNNERTRLFLNDLRRGNNILIDLYEIIPFHNKVQYLDLKNNEINDCSILSRIPLYNLQSLDLALNNIKNINFLIKMDSGLIKELYLNHNFITNISPLLKIKFEKLKVLTLNKNNINIKDEYNWDIIKRLVDKGIAIDIYPNGDYEIEE